MPFYFGYEFNLFVAVLYDLNNLSVQRENSKFLLFLMSIFVFVVKKTPDHLDALSVDG
jgi:hypothetical protein